MKSKRFMGVIALAVCAVLAFGGQSFAEEFYWPTPGYTTILQWNVPGHSCRYGYNALDIDVPVGTKVYAAADGTVITRKTIPGNNGYGGYDSFGKYIEIQHSDGNITLYAHLNNFNVSQGQKVKRGDLIAWSGRLGNTGGYPHLHYEMSKWDIGEYYRTNGYRDPRAMTPPTITYTPSEAAVAGVYYSYQCKADGDVTTWSLEGDVPPGLSINPSTGEISGTPSSTASGLYAHTAKSYKFKVKATNSGGTAERSASISVYEPPNITTDSLPDGKVNVSYRQEINASGTEFSMNWKVISGKIPPGLTFNGSRNSRKAIISGTPTTPGIYRFKVRLYNLVGNLETTTTKIYTIKIGEPTPEPNMWIDGQFATPGQVGTKYSSSIRLYLLSSMYLSRWMAGSLVSVIDGELPPGLSLRWTTLSGIGSYMWANITLSGTPTEAGTYTFTIRALNGSGGYTDSTQTIYIPQRSAAFKDSSMSILFTFRKGKLGTPYDDYVAVYGGSAPYTVEVLSSTFSTAEGILPYGLSPYVSGRYIHLEGTPRRTGTFTFTLRVKGAHNGYAEKTFAMTINNNNSYGAAPGTDDGSSSKPELLTDKLPAAIIGSEYTATLEAYGAEPITWSCDNLPEGFILTEDGVLSGIPSEEGTYSFDITAANSEGSTTQTFTLAVKPEKPTITTLMLPYGMVNEPYSFMLDSEGDSITWSTTGNLPNGLTLNKNTGEISGTPTADGTYTFTAKAKNITGTSTAQLKIIIVDEGTAYDDSDEDTELPEVHASNNIELYSLNGGETGGTVHVTAGTPLTFKIGSDEDAEDGAEISGLKVFMNDSAVSGVSVANNGTFTIPGGLVRGSFTVYASAVYDGLAVETSDVNVVASAASNGQQETPSEQENHSGDGQQNTPNEGDTTNNNPSGSVEQEDSSGDGQQNNSSETTTNNNTSGNTGRDDSSGSTGSRNSSGSNSQERQSGSEGQGGGGSSGGGGCNVNFAGIFILLMSCTVLLKKK